MIASGAAWTRHGRLMDGAAGDGGLPREYHRRAELISLIGSVRLREEIGLGNGAMRLHSRSGDDRRAGSSHPAW